MSDKLSDYDYELPAELIAQTPAERRDEARLLVVCRATGAQTHRRIADLPELLRPGDLLVLNDSRVIRARLLGQRSATGGRWEGLFLNASADGTWRLLCQTRGRLRSGETITVHPGFAETCAKRLILELQNCDAEGIWSAKPREQIDPFAALEEFGTLPLPPYIARDIVRDEDFSRYQTLFADRPGSVAAPTAGLHFTPELFERCAARGIRRAFVTLHVGIGTFRPVTAARLSEHRMHAEWCEVSAEIADAIRETQKGGGRVVAVGTTTTRTLESAATKGESGRFDGATDLFIRPPYQFQAIDALLTNFHLPRSTLLALVSAFAGRETIRRAYSAAIRERYRFYSYGDAMLIL
ncbi:MAG: tRNA preQ1(34) S-adenosylmethionine ribosyltransferase-isomerase QueA [Planctomycetaceae bacterium]